MRESLTFESLEDTIITTLGPSNFLVADEEECLAIAECCKQLANETRDGIIAWLLRHAEPGEFIPAEKLIRVLYRAVVERWNIASDAVTAPV